MDVLQPSLNALQPSLTGTECETRKRSAMSEDQLLNSPETDETNASAMPGDQESQEEIKSIIQELRKKEFSQIENKQVWLTFFGDSSDEMLMNQFIIGFDGILDNILSRAMVERLSRCSCNQDSCDECLMGAPVIGNSIWMQEKIMKLKGLLNAYKEQYVHPNKAHPLRLECDNAEFMSLWRECNELIESMEHVTEENDYALMNVVTYCSDLKKMMEAIALKIGVAGLSSSLKGHTSPKEILLGTKTFFVDSGEMVRRNFKANVTVTDDVVAFLVKVEKFLKKK